MRPQGLSAQIDATGTYVRFSTKPTIRRTLATGMPSVAGDSDDPFLARVIDVVVGNSGREILHLEILGVPDQVIDQFRHAHLLTA